MKTTRYWNKFGALATLGAVVAVPLIQAESAQAQTPSYYRARPVRNVTIEGVVQRDLRGNGRFLLRRSNGRTVEVLTRTAEPVRLSRGDSVIVRGYFSGNLFRANSVRITSNAGGDDETARRGVVTRDYYGRQFQLRADNGSTYYVRTLRAEPIRLSRGDRVEVRGRNGDDNVFIASRVIILRNR